jgi:hypothetical protein
MSGPNISIARKDYDALAAEIINKAFDTESFVPKIYMHERLAKGATASTEVDFDHGLPYKPRAMCYLEVDDDPLTVAFHRGGIYTDDDKAYMTPGTYYDYSTSPYTENDATGVYAIMMLDPIGTPTAKTAPIKPTEPVVIVGGTDGCSDYERKLHTHYDSLKVMHSGTLTIEVDAEEIDDTDNHWETATYTHNLGYIPIFAPFVPYSEDLGAFYSWYYQWYTYQNGGVWATGIQYGPNHRTKHDGTWYECFKYHTSSSSTEPGTGADWEDYWELDTNYTEWATSTAYVVGDITEVHYDQWVSGTSYDMFVNYVCYNDGVDYWCIQAHTASSSNEPGVGANWEDYWSVTDTPAYYCHTAHTSGSSTKPGSGASWADKWWNLGDIGVRGDIYLNEHEQSRYVFGGAVAFKTEAVYFYATETQIVMKYLRRAYDDGFGWQDNKFAKTTITCDYTVFYNRLDEDFNLLTT